MNISALDLLTCCSDCNYGCTGGRPVEGWYYWSSTGVVTGGKYGTNDVSCYIQIKICTNFKIQGCKAYSIEPCDHYVDGSCEFMGYAPDCVKACDEGSSLEYDSDLKTGAPYYVVQTEAQIQTEIMTNGPVAASFDMYQNLLSYKSGTLFLVGKEKVNNTAFQMYINKSLDGLSDEKLLSLLVGEWKKVFLIG